MVYRLRDWKRVRDYLSLHKDVGVCFALERAGLVTKWSECADMIYKRKNILRELLGCTDMYTQDGFEACLLLAFEDLGAVLGFKATQENFDKFLEHYEYEASVFLNVHGKEHKL